MPKSLRALLSDLASNFASSVLVAIRGASLEEILDKTSRGASRRGPGRPRGSFKKAKTIAHAEVSRAPARRSVGRLRRRSPQEIAKALENVVALVKSKKDGLRAGQIRAELKMEAKELPRVLREGLIKKQLKANGWKRATVYTAVGL
jgi:hypothetical protein